MQQMPLSARTRAPPSRTVSYLRTNPLTQDKFIGDGVAHDGGSQTDAGRASACRVDASGSNLGDELQQLGLGHTGISHETDVDVTADPHAVGSGARAATDQEQQDGLLDILMAVDFRRNAARQSAVRVLAAAQLADDALHGLVTVGVFVRLLVLVDILRLQEGIGEETCPHGLESREGGGEEDA